MNLTQLIERLKKIEQEALDKGLDCSEIEIPLSSGGIVVAKQDLKNGRKLGMLICSR